MQEQIFCPHNTKRRRAFPSGTDYYFANLWGGPGSNSSSKFLRVLISTGNWQVGAKKKAVARGCIRSATDEPWRSTLSAWTLDGPPSRWVVGCGSPFCRTKAKFSRASKPLFLVRDMLGEKISRFAPQELGKSPSPCIGSLIELREKRERHISDALAQTTCPTT